MSFNTWRNKNSSKLGIVSLGYDLDRCWRASRAETKAAFKRKVMKILDRYSRGDDVTQADYIKEEIKKL